MPLFDFKCPGCDTVVSDVLIRVVDSAPKVGCPKCGRPCAKQFGVPAAHVFKPYYEYNMGPGPVLIDSRETLKRESRKRGLTPAGL